MGQEPISLCKAQVQNYIEQAGAPYPSQKYGTDTPCAGSVVFGQECRQNGRILLANPLGSPQVVRVS
jgi:hypothetical protein